MFGLVSIELVHLRQKGLQLPRLRKRNYHWQNYQYTYPQDNPTTDKKNCIILSWEKKIHRYGNKWNVDVVKQRKLLSIAYWCPGLELICNEVILLRGMTFSGLDVFIPYTLYLGYEKNWNLTLDFMGEKEIVKK